MPEDPPGEGLRYDLETGRWVEDVDPLPWRNSFFVWDHSVTTWTFDPTAGVTYDPTYIQTFSLRPRWYLADSVSIRLREDLELELTDSDTRARNREPVFSDVQLALMDSSIVTLPGDVAVSGGIITFAPLSIASRNANLVFGAMGLVSLTRVFEDVLGGLTLQGYGTLRYNFHSKNVPTTESNLYGAPFVASAGDTDVLNQLGAPSNADVIGNLGLSVSLAITDTIWLGIDYEGQWANGRGLADACVDTTRVVVAASPDLCLADQSKTKLRAATYVGVSGTWVPVDWLSLSLGISSFTSQLAPSGSYYNPFDNPSTLVSLTAFVTMDQLYADLAD